MFLYMYIKKGEPKFALWVGKLPASRRYNLLPLLRSSPGGFTGSWPYRTYPYTCKPITFLLQTTAFLPFAMQRYSFFLILQGITAKIIIFRVLKNKKSLLLYLANGQATTDKSLPNQYSCHHSTTIAEINKNIN